MKRAGQFLFAVLFSLSPLLRADATDEHPVKASLIAETAGFTPGQALTVALRLRMQPHWHTYWRDPGDAGLASSVEWKLPPGLKASGILWPKPEVFNDPGGLIGYGYQDEALLLTEIKIPKAYSAATLEITAQSTWLVCKEICIPGDAGVSLTLERMPAPAASAQAADIALARKTLGQLPKGYKDPNSAKKLIGLVTAVRDEDLSSFEGAPTPSGEAGSAPGLRGPAAASDEGLPGTSAQAFETSLLWMLLLAFVGGLILNLMPCVLPVLSLKALAFVEQAQVSRAQSARLGLAFGAGVLASFWVLAGLVIALKGAGSAVGWGFQFQSPAFVLFMSALVLVFALNLFGLFEILLPGSAMQGMSQAASGHGLAGAFGHGIFMTLLATPCTAPFLGTALGFAFAASGVTLLLIFSAVALGLAAPFMLLAAVPQARAWLPKPGVWMLRFKELMGFLLLATLIWLLFVLTRQVGAERAARASAWLLLLAMGTWAWDRWGGLQQSAARRRSLVAWLFLGLSASGVWLLPEALKVSTAKADVGEGWLAFDPAEVERLRSQGKTLFIDFTADWCWTCKVNEKAVLGNAAVQAVFKAKDVVLIKGDWTRRDPVISEALRGFGRSGVPLYVIYRGTAPAQVLPEVVTPGLIVKALE